MKGRSVKILVLMTVMLLAFSLCGANGLYGITQSSDICAMSVCAEETTAVDDGLSGQSASTSEKVSSDDSLSDGAQSSNLQDSDDSTQTAGGKPVKIYSTAVIVVSCAISLALAIILAVRKANKVYGKEW